MQCFFDTGFGTFKGFGTFNLLFSITTTNPTIVSPEITIGFGTCLFVVSEIRMRENPTLSHHIDY